MEYVEGVSMSDLSDDQKEVVAREIENSSFNNA